VGTDEDLMSAAREQLADMVALRRRLHRRPELGLILPATQAAVLDALDGLGLTVQTGRELSSVIATLDGGPGPTVLLRADMDALPLAEQTGLEFASEIPGAMHACGHDAHTAMLVGAARLLAADPPPGKVIFAFQPGEEGFYGARAMLAEGLLDGGVDAAFALHVDSNAPSGFYGTRGGAVMASGDTFGITVTGRGGHASMPHLGLDPVPIACEIVQALQTYVARRVDPFAPAIVSVTRIQAGGEVLNVQPVTATLEGTMRAAGEGTRADAIASMRRLAEGIAAAHGASAELQLTPGYPVTVNNPGFARLTLRAATGLLGRSYAAEMPAPAMASEDFSYVLQQVPGALGFLGAAPPGVAQPAPLHSPTMVLDEDAMATGAALHVAFVRAVAEATATAG